MFYKHNSFSGRVSQADAAAAYQPQVYPISKYFLLYFGYKPSSYIYKIPFLLFVISNMSLYFYL